MITETNNTITVFLLNPKLTVRFKTWKSSLLNRQKYCKHSLEAQQFTTHSKIYKTNLLIHTSN